MELPVRVSCPYLQERIFRIAGRAEPLTEMRWLISREIPHLRRYAFALLGDRSRADDLVQDTLERALRKSSLWSGRGTLRSWLFRLLYRRFLNDRKTFHERRMVPSEEIGAYESPVSGGQEGRVALAEALSGLSLLPREQRAAILLVSLEDFSYDEAARILGVPIGTLRSRLSRGREALRISMESGPAGRKLRRVK